MSLGSIVVDTDPGIDDAVALALLLVMAKERVRGITTTYGNCSLTWATANTQAVLALCGATELPIVAGAARPLCRAAEYALDTHGVTGLGYAQVVATPVAAYNPRAIENRLWAADALIQWAGAGNLVLICLGPLTNLALALARNREAILDGVSRVVIMGGSAGAAGNTTPVSEFNFWSDPEAARAVMHSGLPISMVGLDVTRKMVFPASALTQLHKAAGERGDQLLQVFANAIRFYKEFHERAEGLSGCIINDPLAVLLALNPNLAMSQPMYVTVDCSDGPTRGQSICDRYGQLKTDPNAKVYVQLDGPAIMHDVWQQLAPGVFTPGDFY